jgi:protein-tyrosine kinase
MSIVERAADILTGFPAPHGRQQDIGRNEASPHIDLIERAAAQAGVDSPVLEDIDRQPVPPPDDGPPRVPTSRRVSIALNKLRAGQMILPDDDRSPLTENFRRVKRHVISEIDHRRKLSGGNQNLIMVTSALPGEGKTYCAVNLAISMAIEVNRTVLLVDGDVAKPSVTSLLGIRTDDERGLMDVLTGRGIPLSDVLCRTDIGTLSVLPAGRRSRRATEMLSSDAMRELLADMAGRYEDRIIIFDSPPLLAASEACALATSMSQILMIVEAGRTTEAALSDALARIQACPAVGIVLNKGTERGSGMGGYGYGYGYGD